MIIRALIKWVYLQKIEKETSLEENLQILEAANFLGLLEMLRPYGEKIETELSRENAIDILIFADRNYAKKGVKEGMLGVHPSGECRDPE